MLVATTKMSERNSEDRLQAEIQQEKQIKEMLGQSVNELQLTVEDLERKFELLGEENEWKTRFETQQEMNEQLERQCELLQQKIEDAHKTLSDARKPKAVRRSTDFEDVREVTGYLVKSLEKEKAFLENQIRDMEWKLDQESKAYHKANEERNQFLLEIKGAGSQIADTKLRRGREQDDKIAQRGGLNIPEDQRILDPKRGPIRKTAAVKKLEKI